MIEWTFCEACEKHYSNYTPDEFRCAECRDWQYDVDEMDCN